jgi:putative multiple sugar transport system substrate-binding protein
MLAASVVTSTACLGLAACTPTPSGPPVAVLFPGETDDAWGASAEVLRRELADDGYAVEVRLAGDDIPTQLEQLHEALDADPIAVVIAPVDATAIAAVLDEEAPPDVAVIAYDDLILDSARLDYFATFDHRAAGRMQAQALVDALGLPEHLGGQALAVELLAGSGDDRGAQDAFAGALEVLQPYLDAGRLTVPSGRVALEQAAVLRGDPAAAAERVAALLDEGVVLAGVLSPSDAMSAAIAEVIADAGFEIVPPGGRWTASPVPPEQGGEPDAGAPAIALTGGGASRDGARAVRDGTQTATVYEDPRELARVVASMVREVASGSAPTVTQGATTDNGIREVPTRLLEPQLVATREDAAKLL